VQRPQAARFNRFDFNDLHGQSREGGRPGGCGYAAFVTWRDSRLIVLVPLLAGIAAHVLALGNGFTNWDDPQYLLHNAQTVAPLKGGWLALLTTPEIDYAIPLTVLGYAGQRGLFGLDPLAFHAVSLLLHLCAVGLTFALARRLGLSRLAAALGATVFAAHPITVEPVAWVVGQKDLLATLLVVAALYVRSLEITMPRLVGTAVLGCLAFAAKPSAVSAPVLLMALDWYLSRRWREPKNALLYALLFIGALGATTLAIVGHSDLEHPATFGLATVINVGWAASLQLGHLLVPTSLAAAYYAPEGVIYGVYVVLGLLAATALVLAVWRLARTEHRVAAFSLAAALLAYAPMSGLIQISRGPADSYLYTPLAMLVPAIGLGLDKLVHRDSRPLRTLVPVILIVAVLVSAMRSRVWSGAESLWEDVLVQNPDRPIAYLRFANALQYSGKLEASLEVFDEIRRRWPNDGPSTVDHAMSLDALGRRVEAEALFALGARLERTAYYRRYYANYLLGHPGLQPSDLELAEDCIAEQIPELLGRRAPAPLLDYAAELLERGGRHPDDVDRLRRLRN